MVVAQFFWPKGGWGRAAMYVRHRLNRLPDPPHRIARGIFAGVFTTFTPFYGLHFVVAALIAVIMRGNIFASIMATFFGNPLTYIPIIMTSMHTGYWLLGMDRHGLAFRPHGHENAPTIGKRFADAGESLWHNFKALFTNDTADWTGLANFYNEIFYPFMIGGILPGLIAGIIAYYVSLPLISAYQNRRRGALKTKLASLKKKKAEAGLD
jgi:uncharacterized protein (DUF2062 family)